MICPHTFLGKVMTLLLGCALSWLTVMHPQWERAVAGLLGATPRQANVAQERARFPAAPHVDRVAHEVPPTAQAKIHAISSRLKQLGVRSLRLERLTDGSGDRYRARCALGGGRAPTRSLEAVAGTAVDAMSDVLQAVVRSLERPDRPAQGMGFSR